MSFWNRKIVEAGSVVCVSIALLWWNPASFLSPIREALWVAVEPVALFFGDVRLFTVDTFHSFIRIGSLKQENVNLSEEVVTLRARVAELTDMEKENEQLRKEIGASFRTRDRVALALVVGYDSRGVGDWLIINKGSRDGVVSGMTVVFGENVLVGMVEESMETTSRIRLISHPKSVFNVHTVETQAKGVIHGKFGLGMLLGSVLQTDSLHKGDTVVTSELGENYPPGLFVGTIDDVGVSSDGLFQQATIISPINFFNIRLVSVIR